MHLIGIELISLFQICGSLTEKRVDLIVAHILILLLRLLGSGIIESVCLVAERATTLY